MRKVKILQVTLVIVIVAAGFVFLNNRKNTSQVPNEPTKDKPAYSLNLMSGKSYVAASPTTMQLTIQYQGGEVLKDFDIVHEKKLHLIVVRKDRTHFQHVHPTLDEVSGMFTIEPFTFPNDGEYRVYADFTPSNTQENESGGKEAIALHQDVQVGDHSKYMPAVLGTEKLVSSTNGLEMGIFFPPPHDPGLTNTSFYAGEESNIAVTISKSGQAYKNLQTYLGALGHLVVLSPDLEYIHAHPQTTDVSTQGGLIVFSVTFPKSGQYELYLQTKSEDLVNTTDFTLDVKDSAKVDATETPSAPSTEHRGH